MYSENVKMGYGETAAPQVEQNESQAIMSRLHNIRSCLGDARGSAASAADKIVGPEPSKLQPANSQPPVSPVAPPSFMQGMNHMCGELLQLAEDINVQLNRLHRSF